MRFLFIFLLALVISACSSLPQRTALPDQPPGWAQQRDLLESIKGWHLKGRLAVRFGAQADQADLIWNQSSEKVYDLRMIAPLGGSTLHIEGDEDGVTLTLPNGESYYEDSLERLVARADGWDVPVDDLRYWIRALPAPGIPVDKVSWRYGQLVKLQQDGWKVFFKSYKQHDGYQLPGKVFLRKVDDARTDVRLVINEWSSVQ